MKRFACIFLTLILAAALLTGCGPKENPPTVHVVHDGQLYEITRYPNETTSCDLSYWEEQNGTKPVEGKVIPFNVMPSDEGEVNVNAKSVQIFDLSETQFLVIIDGGQYLVER